MLRRRPRDPDRQRHFLYRFCVHPFLDAKGYGSMPAWGMFGLLLTMCARLWPREINGTVFLTTAGWPDAFIVFFAYVGVAVYEAAMTVARLDPVRLLEIVAGKLGVGDVGNQAPVVPAVDVDAPHEWATADKREDLG